MRSTKIWAEDPGGRFEGWNRRHGRRRKDKRARQDVERSAAAASPVALAPDVGRGRALRVKLRLSVAAGGGKPSAGPRRPRRSPSAVAASGVGGAFNRASACPADGSRSPVPRSEATLSFLIGAAVADPADRASDTAATRLEFRFGTTQKSFLWKASDVRSSTLDRFNLNPLKQVYKRFSLRKSPPSRGWARRFSTLHLETFDRTNPLRLRLRGVGAVVRFALFNSRAFDLCALFNPHLVDVVNE